MLPGNSGPAPESEPDIEITEKGQRVPSLFEKGLLWRRFMEVEVHSQGISDKQIKPRLPMREVLHMQRWSEERQKDSVASYNKSLGKFYFEELKLGRKGWG
ncbi:nitroreductase [Penicillium citrinum]|uniref:Nitroreductase n=1 Tax=Penicillium citrinum TaxID=5077 RepID=A0A9W9NQP7_PENCI|nr:nitroreductase [Penicillium citrinum]KAJ5224392.1 nitroreductase [Penicillium citrinum]